MSVFELSKNEYNTNFLKVEKVSSPPNTIYLEVFSTFVNAKDPTATQKRFELFLTETEFVDLVNNLHYLAVHDCDWEWDY